MRGMIRHLYRCVFPVIMLMIPAFLCAGCSAAEKTEKNAAEQTAEQKKEDDFTLLTIGTADSGGSMYAASSAIAAAITLRDDNIRFNIIASTGSFHNIEGLKTREMDLAMVSADAAAEAAEGRGHFEGKQEKDLRAVCAVYPSLSNWLTLSGSSLEYVSDLKGRKAAIGPEDSATEIAAKKALKALGMDPEAPGFINAGLGSGADMVASGEVDAVHAFAGAPVPGLAGLARNHACRLLKYRDEELQKILDAEPAYFPVTILAGTYPGQKGGYPYFWREMSALRECGHAGRASVPSDGADLRRPAGPRGAGRNALADGRSVVPDGRPACGASSGSEEML